MNFSEQQRTFVPFLTSKPTMLTSTLIGITMQLMHLSNPDIEDISWGFHYYVACIPSGTALLSIP